MRHTWDIILAKRLNTGKKLAITKKINKNDCIIWRTDNNGKIGANMDNGNIGKWTYSEKSENGVGKMDKSTSKYNLDITNTNYNPKNNKHEAITWTSGDGEIGKQLDYVMISNKRKNWVSNVKTKGLANISQNYQRAMLQMDITAKLKKIKHGNIKT